MNIIVHAADEAVTDNTLAQHPTVEPGITAATENPATTVTDNATAVTEDNSSDKAASFFFLALFLNIRIIPT